MLRKKDITPNQLVPTKAILDNRRLLDRLRYLIKLSKEVNFYDANNQRNGDWSPFLLKDPLIFNAWLSEAQYREPCQEFLGITHQLENIFENSDFDANWSDETQLMMMRQLGRNLASLFEELHRWFSIISMHHSQQDFGNGILIGLQRDMSPQLRRFLSIQNFLIDLAPQCEDLSGLDLNMVEECWANSGPFNGLEETPLADALGEDFTSPKSCLKIMKNMHEVVFGFYLRSTEQGAKDYNRLLSGFSGKPDTSLVIALASRLDDYSDQLNSFVGRQLDFYYESILKGSPEGEVADEVFLCVKLIKDIEILDIPKGTLFKAGVYSDKKPILFEAVTTESLNAASIESILTLRHMSKGNGEFELLSRGTSDCLGKDAQKSLLSGRNEFGQDLFGCQQGEPTKSEIMIASPLLCLSSGQRTLVVTLGLTASFKVEQLIGSDIFMSTASGWQPVKEINWVQKEEASIQLAITLDTQFPPIQRCIKEPTNLESRWPLLRISMGPKVNLTQRVVIETIKLDIDVDNAQAVFSSDGGILKSATLAYPFGPVPNSGRNLNIHLPELYVKPLTALTVSLSWNKLPSNFEDYYSFYNEYIEIATDQFTNTCFRIEGQQLSEGQWQPLAFMPESLFSQDESGHNSPYSSFSIDTEQGLYCLPSIKNEQSLYETQKQALLRLTLDVSLYGFGHELYPSVIASWSLKQSQQSAVKDSTTNNQISTAPPLPWVPQVKGMTLSYKSSAIIDFRSQSNETSLQLFHQSALSHYLAYDSNSSVANSNAYPLPAPSISDDKTSDPLLPTLFPLSNKAGVVYLSFNNASPELPISLLFQMSSLGATRSLSSAPVSFYYLSTSGWSSFIPLKDETHRLTTSGILTLQLPKDATIDSKLYRTSGYCIAIANDSENGNRGRPVLIDTQAIRTRRILPTGLKDGEPLQLAAFTIKGPNTKINGLQSVSQSFPSFAGREREDKKGFKQRLSQRIRHKSRAVSRYDFECLCLTYLPQAYLARCICDPNNPSNLSLAVIGSHKHSPSVVPPQIGSDSLNYVEVQLAQKSSSFSTIRVFNMLHQPLRISAEVRFQNDHGSKRECGQIAELIRSYMSPWCEQPNPSTDPSKGFHRVDILNLISAQSGVTQVTSLVIETGENNNGEWVYQEKTDGVLYPMSAQYVFVADAAIDIKNVVNESRNMESIS